MRTNSKLTLALIVAIGLGGLASAAARQVFHETFRSAEVGDATAGLKSNITGTDELGWLMESPPTLGQDAGIAQEGDRRMFRAKAKGGGGGGGIVSLSAPLDTPIDLSSAKAVTLRYAFVPTKENAGGPHPTNKMMRLELVDRSSGAGYGVAFDIQTNEKSSDNCLLAAYVRKDRNMPSGKAISENKEGAWVGPRMCKEFAGVPFIATCAFHPMGDRTKVDWQLENVKTGKTESGSVTIASAPPMTNLGYVFLVPERWTDGKVTEIAVSVD